MDILDNLFEPGATKLQQQAKGLDATTLQVNEPGTLSGMILNNESPLSALHTHYQVHQKTIRTLCRDGYTNGAIEATVTLNTYLELFQANGVNPSDFKTWSGSNKQWLRDIDRKISYAIKQGLIYPTAGRQKKGLGLTSAGQQLIDKYTETFIKACNDYHAGALKSDKRRKKKPVRNFDSDHFIPAPVKPYSTVQH